MNMPNFRLFLAGALSLAAGFATAAEAPRSGEEIAQSQCVACHGPKGVAQIAIYPTLAGQYEDYLYHALMAYKNGSRKNAIMAGQVANLTKQDLRALSAYYAKQDGGLVTVPNPDR